MPKPARFVHPFRQNTDFMATIIALTKTVVMLLAFMLIIISISSPPTLTFQT